MILNIKLDPGAFMPKHAHSSDAGWDLCAKNGFLLRAGEGIAHDTGVHIDIPEGYCGLLVSKSGLNVKHNITGTGLIDAGYTGSIVVKLYNHSKGHDYEFKTGDKIIQLVLLKIPDVERLELVSELEGRERGNNGFGSSGK